MRIWWIAILAGCGDGTVPPLDAAAPPDAFVSHAMETGTVVDFKTGAPVAGAQLCVHGLPGEPCATSDATGAYAIDIAVPDGISQVAQITTASGYLGREAQFVEHPDADGSGNRFVVWEDLGGIYSAGDATTLLATQAGFTYPTTTHGFLRIRVSGSTVASTPAATATISPASGTGPVYTDDTGTPTPSLTSTIAGKQGEIYFGDLAPGTYQVTVRSADHSCSVVVGGGLVLGDWPPTASGATLTAAVSANTLTWGLFVNCS